MSFVRSLPPGEKPYKLAAALNLLDAQRLEARLIDRMWQLRTRGRRGRPMTIRQVSEYLAVRGEPTSPGWLSEFYTATKPHDPAA